MAKRVCVEPGCPELIDTGSRCTTHTRATDQARGTRQQRGYDAAFDAAKRTPEYRNATHCDTCGEPFTAANPKTAGHVRAIRKHGPNDAGIGPQCRRCNYGWRKTDT